jgi:hypothetical protein
MTLLLTCRANEEAIIMRKLLATLAVGACGLLATASGSAAAPPNAGCSPPFTATSFAAAVARIQAEGFTGDLTPFLAFLEQTDRNDDEVVCVKDIPDTPGNLPWQHIYVDNVTANP